jgi:eukaryotic-like serine/threonine-protein kinase
MRAGKLISRGGSTLKPLPNFRKSSITANIVLSDPMGAVAIWQLGKAFAMTGDTARAKLAYDEFLSLWKDADSNLPALIQAKAEYGRLR